jgi:hypothetical protein
MGLRQRFFNRNESGGGDDPAPGGGTATAGDLAIDGYERLGDKEVMNRLSDLSQAELGEIEDFERAHKARPVVLNKLAWLREPEPLPDYDKLSPEEIAKALAGADAAKVKEVRQYEHKFQNRQEVAQEVTRLLQTAPPSAEETRAQDEKDERTRKGIRDRP